MKSIMMTVAVCTGFLLSLHLSGLAQGTKLGTPKIDNRNPQQNFGADNHFLLREADRQLRLLDFEQANLTLDNAVAQEPQSVYALIQRAKYYKMLGRKAEADADIRRVRRLNPYAADLFGYYGPQGIFNLIAFEPEQALLHAEHYHLFTTYRQLFEFQSLPAAEYAGLLEVLQQIEEGLLLEALLGLDELVEAYPDSPFAYDLKGMLLIRQGRYKEAEVVLGRAAVLHPTYSIVWYNYGQLERNGGQYQKAMDYFNRAVELQEDFTSAYFMRAALHKAAGNYEAAIDDYSQIIRLQGEESLEALVNRGLTRKMAGDFRGALSDLDRVLAYLPDEADLYKNRANLYLLFGYINLAIQDYTLAIEKETDFAAAYYNRGLAHLLRFDPLSGCRDLQQSAELGLERARQMQRYFCTE